MDYYKLNKGDFKLRLSDVLSLLEESVYSLTPDIKLSEINKQQTKETSLLSPRKNSDVYSLSCLKDISIIYMCTIIQSKQLLILIYLQDFSVSLHREYTIMRLEMHSYYSRS